MSYCRLIRIHRSPPMTDVTRSQFRKPPLRPRPRARPVAHAAARAHCRPPASRSGSLSICSGRAGQAPRSRPMPPPIRSRSRASAFNVPPAAIRVSVQRRPGAHERVDLAFLWPSLEPPDPNAKAVAPTPEGAPIPVQPTERLFVTISECRRHAGPGRARACDLSALRRGRCHRRPRRPVHAAVPRGHAVSGRRPDLPGAARTTASSFAARATAPAPRRASASTSGGSSAPMWWCDFRATGLPTGARWRRKSIG